MPRANDREFPICPLMDGRCIGAACAWSVTVEPDEEGRTRYVCALTQVAKGVAVIDRRMSGDDPCRRS